MMILLKARNVKGYTRADGVYVPPHTDRRPAASPDQLVLFPAMVPLELHQEALTVRAESDIDPNAKVTFPVLYRGTEGGRDPRAALRTTFGGDLGDGVYFTAERWLAETYGGGPRSKISDGTRVVHEYRLARTLNPDEVAYAFGKGNPRIVSGTGVLLFEGKWPGGHGDRGSWPAIDDSKIKVIVGTPDSFLLNQISVRDASLIEHAVEPAPIGYADDAPKDETAYLPNLETFAKTYVPKSTPTGSWTIFNIAHQYGRDIEQLIEIDPALIEVSEDTGPPKYADVLRYAEAMRAGKAGDFQPIQIVQTNKGTLKVIDGHRRRLAALLTGNRIRAWVSWCVKAPSGADVGLTYELAMSGAKPSAPFNPPRPEFVMFDDDRKWFDKTIDALNRGRKPTP